MPLLNQRLSQEYTMTESNVSIAVLEFFFFLVTKHSPLNLCDGRTVLTLLVHSTDNVGVTSEETVGEAIASSTG